MVRQMMAPGEFIEAVGVTGEHGDTVLDRVRRTTGAGLANERATLRILRPTGPSPQARQAAIAFATAQLGKPYNYAFSDVLGGDRAFYCSSLAYRAYKIALGGKEDKVIDGLTGDQRFFLAWAQVWRETIRPERLRQQMLTDPHSPAEYRVNGQVRNSDAWYKAFNVQPGDKLYLPPEQRVHIW